LIMELLTSNVPRKGTVARAMRTWGGAILGDCGIVIVNLRVGD